ncbi:endonuclease [Rheinheimera sp. 4Y26]|uniref:endonuclease n=1 Tax=Rheinheimera sp. 4Y26 TaxID=2977811 RepID=UPI0021B0CA1E|nr:endonuclease [Rheinheimera sp. 4Y26]MCT6699455.1 endonuclease [Rheinheimera sp. 4Y26]
MLLRLCFVVFGLMLCAPLMAAPDDFSEAKKIAQRIYADETETFYCACPLRWQGGKGIPDLKACGYEVRKNGPRASRIEWEHVVPAHHFGKSLSCWQQGGRDQCQQSDQQFRLMEADLFNLKPAIGEVNGDRANFAFALLPSQASQYGDCPFKVDFKRQLAEPRSEVRGDIARIYFYMADKYKLNLSKAQQQLLISWHQEDPVDDRELLINRRIAQHMGHPNYFVTGARNWLPGYQPTGYGLPPEFSTQHQANTTGSALTQQVAEDSLQGNLDIQRQVLGNQNSKIYHLSTCPGFSQVSAKNQRWFSDEQQALAAGFRKAKNCD